MAVSGALVHFVMVDESRAAMPVSKGYLIVDVKKCQGCLSCMLACSLVHTGEASLSRSRIQVLQNSFEKWPEDLTIEQCRQCADAPCVAVCPNGALRVDKEHGNVRWIDPAKCVGCTMCIDECPHTPKRLVSVPDKKQAAGLRVEKCDLCSYARFHWIKERQRLPSTQACAAVCPVEAIQFTEKLPAQTGDAGYKVNLRDENWAKLGFPTD
jgi:Fe-S-cluster-containing dehydrogenase component